MLYKHYKWIHNHPPILKTTHLLTESQVPKRIRCIRCQILNGTNPSTGFSPEP